MENTMVTISLEKYEQLVKTSTRVDAVVELLMEERYASPEVLLLLLGTELSVTLSEEMKESRERAMITNEELD